MFCEKFRVHDRASEGFVGDVIALDEDLRTDMQGGFWAILADKEYRGAGE